MPVDWDTLNKEIDNILKSAACHTDEKLAERISSLTHMTDKEIQEIFPNAGDKKRLTELMTIVKSAKNRNEKINQIMSNLEAFGGIVLTLLDRFV